MRTLATAVLLLAVPALLRAEESSLADRAAALARHWEETHPDSRQLLRRVFADADAIRARDRSHVPIRWTDALRMAARDMTFRADHAFWLAKLALEGDAHAPYAVATLGSVPGADARTVLLALLPDLARTLRACDAPLDRAFLWSRLGRDREDRHVLDLLAPGLGTADREFLLAALAPGEWKKPAFYLRVGLLERAPESLLDDAMHEILWRMAETGRPTAGLNVAASTAVKVLARYRDPRDTERLDRLVAAGQTDESCYALRELLRRSDDPRAVFLAQLDHEEPARRHVAATTLIVDFHSSPKLPVPRSLETWRTFRRVLTTRILTEEDEMLRNRELEALRAVAMPSRFTPMRESTLDDDRAVVTFCGRLIEHHPDVHATCSAADLLFWLRVPEALALLETLAADGDEGVAKTARRAAEHVRARLRR